MAAQEAKEKKSIFESPIFQSRIKSANVKIFPEGGLGYLVGPTLALLANSILAGYFNRYMSDILGMTTWGTFGKLFFMWLPVISVIFVVIGNILVGRLMDRCRTKAGKARPLMLLSIPLSVVALLFLFVFAPFDVASEGGQTMLMVMIAIGYNLWFAIAYPFFFTSHSALVNLSTRNSKDRSLLATISNATALAAMGLTSMILPFFLGMLFVNQVNPDLIPALNGYTYGATTDGVRKILVDGAVIALATLDAKTGAITQIANKATNVVYLDAEASFNHWKIFVIALMVITAVGIIIEFMFTRERVTEESFLGKEVETKKATPIGKQAKACFKDKFWWIMIAFFFLYQLGGMLKNVSQLYFCSALFPIDGVYSTANGGTVQGTLSIIGAIPTAVGMVIAWPLSNKIGKGKAILFGAILAVGGGALGFIDPSNFVLVVVSFVIKALGSTPAMYLSLALLADVLDHQEAQHGFRTDGFTMTIYGAIMAGMTGIATGVLNIVIDACGYAPEAVSNEALRSAMPWVFIGGETICYGLIVLIFIFMGVEKFSKFDHKAITQDQKKLAEEEGKEYIDPAEKLKMEEAEAEAASEEARKQELRHKCEKKGLNFEDEEAKYQAAKKVKDDAAAAKKAAADAKKAAAEKAKQDKYDALSDAEKAAIQKKAEEKAKKQAAYEAAVLVEFNKLRIQHGREALISDEVSEVNAEN